jgi:hypothetical protein
MLRTSPNTISYSVLCGFWEHILTRPVCKSLLRWPRRKETLAYIPYLAKISICRGQAYVRAHRDLDALLVLQCFALVTSAFQSLDLTGLDSIALDQFDQATGWVRLVRKGCG